MIDTFVNTKVLGRGKTPSLLLLHGLFANSAFWLAHLSACTRYRVVLVNIDYAGLFESTYSVEQLAAHLDDRLELDGADLIAHSFGACVGLYMRAPVRSRSFICPTFAASAFHSNKFCKEIGELTSASGDQVRPIVDYAVEFKSRQLSVSCDPSRDQLYLPVDDPYFDYPPGVAGIRSHHFRGGHFDVREPMAAILADTAAADGL